MEPIRTTESAGGGGFLQRVVTNRSAIVPRGKRRGLLAGLSILPEVENPMEYKRPIKHLITAIVALAGASAPMASAIVFPALGEISQQLHSTPTLTNLSVAMYMIGMAIFPLWWSSFAERVGYRTIYIISFSCYVISNICAALSVDIAMLIVFRVCSGASAASAQSVGAGTIASIWAVRERGTAMGVFYLGPLCGPLLAPIIGGALTQQLGWRATQWFLAIFGVSLLVMMIFCLPETLTRTAPAPLAAVSEKAPEADTAADGPPNLTRTLSRISSRTRNRTRTLSANLMILFVDPLRALKFMKFPPVLLTVYWASFTFGCLYILNVSLQTTFAKPPYNFSTLIIGLLYIPGSLGYFASSILGGRWNDIVMRRAALKRRAATAAENPEVAADPDAPLEFRPEDRMGVNAYVAGALFPLALLWYGWVVQNGVFWVAPMFATFCFGLGSMLVFSMSTTMLTEFVPGRSSSAVAVNNFFRNIFSCVGGIVAEPLISAIGNGWVFTILAIWGLMSIVVVFIMHRKGPQWREKAHTYNFM
ncbi:major facilitator superfamily domain-containing protein [Geopyxis carbonaria]|nr:major facilitator superfamily domain-containing protein [Geopyxis carbonaria]